MKNIPSQAILNKFVLQTYPESFLIFQGKNKFIFKEITFKENKNYDKGPSTQT